MITTTGSGWIGVYYLNQGAAHWMVGHVGYIPAALAVAMVIGIVSKFLRSV